MNRRQLIAAGAATVGLGALGTWAVAAAGTGEPNATVVGRPVLGVAAGGYYDTDAVARFETAVDVPVRYCLPIFSDVADGLSGDHLRRVSKAGFTPEVTWQPGRATVAAIAAGNWDDELRRAARYISGLDVRIRFGHEMNGMWNASSTDPDNYVQAWRRTHRIFSGEGTAATWVWTPNILSDHVVPFPQFFPGDDFCDSIGLDGYANRNNGYRSFERLFASGFAQLQDMSARPLVVGETGIARGAPDRTAWIADMFDWLVTDRAVGGLTWWNRDDYVITDDAKALTAFTRGAVKWRARS